MTTIQPSRAPPSTTTPNTTFNTTSVTPNEIHLHLSSLPPILDAFNHRSKNQHCASHWWSHFNILRRSIHKLVDARPLDGPSLMSSLRFLRDRIIPSAYLRFSQLAADNQFAPLGLVLLAILARVSSVVTQCLPLPSGQRRPTPSDSAPSRLYSTRPVSPEATGRELDKGVVVSRSAASFSNTSHIGEGMIPLPPSNPTPPSKPESIPPIISSSMPTPPATAQGKSKKDKKKGSSKKSKSDELSSLFGSL